MTVIAVPEEEVDLSSVLAREDERKDFGQPLIGVYSRLVVSFIRCGNYEQSEQIQRHKLRRMEQALGAKHPRLIAELTRLTGILCIEHKYSEAITHLRTIIDMLEQSPDYNGPRLATYLNMLAGIYLELRIYTEAEPLLGRSLTIRQIYLPANHPDIQASLRDYAWFLYKTDRSCEGEKMLVQARVSRSRACAC